MIQSMNRSGIKHEIPGGFSSFMVIDALHRY